MTSTSAKDGNLHILLLAEGDPDSPMGSGSGIPASLAVGLRSLGHTVTTRDIEVRGLVRALVALLTWSPIRTRWIAKYHLSRVGFAARARNARRAVATTAAVDAVLQYGATFSAAGEGKPVFLFCDSNTLFSSREPRSWGSALSPSGLREAVALEGQLYSAAASIFTMSHYIAKSFVDEFAVCPERAIAVGAGPNADPASLLSITRGEGQRAAAPSILFIGREFERKGGDVLVEAFKQVRRSIPEARLTIIGPKLPMQLPEGAEFLGFLDRTAPTDWAKIQEAFENATVFTLPARHEPFGLVVLEAMYAALPVVATRIGALKEMVEEGVTGYLVAPSNVDELANALLRVLNDPDSAAMGQVGRQRATQTYSWSRVTETIAAVIGKSVRR